MKIINELKELLPPLTPDEKEALKQSIILEGCREPLVLWGDMLIDGHNRYNICTENGIMYTTIQREFEDIDQVKLWMIKNQEGRRNLTDGQKFAIVQVKRAILLRIGKEKMSEAGKANEGLSIIDRPSEHSTQQEIAKDLGWSTGKTAMAQMVWDSGHDDLIEDIKGGELTISGAHKELKRRIKKEVHEEEVTKIRENLLNAPPVTGKYDVVILDPPWEYGRKYDPDTSRIASPYPEQSIEEIHETCKDFFKNDCVLWLWTTHKFLPDALELVKKWGFEYRATLIWNKDKMGMGNYLRMQLEFCILATRGNALFANTTERDIITEKRREHSRKPDAFYDLVKKTCSGEIFEYYSRENREGIISMGVESGKMG